MVAVRVKPGTGATQRPAVLACENRTAPAVVHCSFSNTDLPTLALSVIRASPSPLQPSRVPWQLNRPPISAPAAATAQQMSGVKQHVSASTARPLGREHGHLGAANLAAWAGRHTGSYAMEVPEPRVSADRRCPCRRHQPV